MKVLVEGHKRCSIDKLIEKKGYDLARVNSIEDIPLKEFYMHGNFLELLFKGMERNPGYTSECINIILLTGKACANEILQKLCRTGEKMANNNLIL